MRNKIIAAIAAGGLLVGAAFVATVVSTPSTASAQEDTTETQEKGHLQRGMDFLSEVLSDLVGDGTIDQTQADAITSAVETAAEELRAEREALKELTQQFLEDDVITQDEAAQLGDDHPFNSERYDEAWEDGELTKDEIRESSRRGKGFRRGAHFGALLDDGGIDQEEYDSLDADHPLKQIDLSEYLEDDGLITIEELKEAGEQLPNGWRGLKGSDSDAGSDA